MARYPNAKIWTTLCALFLIPGVGIIGSGVLISGLLSLFEDQDTIVFLRNLFFLALAMFCITKNQYRRFRKEAHRDLLFNQFINSKYLYKDNPSKPLISPSSSWFGYVLRGYSIVIWYGIIGSIALLMATSINRMPGERFLQIISATVLVAVKLAGSITLIYLMKPFYGDTSSPEEREQRLIDSLDSGCTTVVPRTTASN